MIGVWVLIVQVCAVAGQLISIGHMVCLCDLESCHHMQGGVGYSRTETRTCCCQTFKGAICLSDCIALASIADEPHTVLLCCACLEDSTCPLLSVPCRMAACMQKAQTALHLSTSTLEWVTYWLIILWWGDDAMGPAVC